MPYNLQMSTAQIARCNRSLDAQHHIAARRIVRSVNGHEFHDEAVVIYAEGIQHIIDALRRRPEPGDHSTQEDWDNMDVERLNLTDIADTLELVLAEAEADADVLHGICL